MLLIALGVGEIGLTATRSLRLLPCEGAAGLGAANWVLDAVALVASGIPGIDGLEEAAVVGVADWKSSKSSSSAAPVSSGFVLDFLILEVNSFGGVSGGMSSSKAKMSISGSFGLGGSAFFCSRFGTSAFRREVDEISPSSPSSYSSNRSLLLLESWKLDVFPPKPPPSP